VTALLHQSGGPWPMRSFSRRRSPNRPRPRSPLMLSSRC